MASTEEKYLADLYWVERERRMQQRALGRMLDRIEPIVAEIVARLSEREA